GTSEFSRMAADDLAAGNFSTSDIEAAARLFEELAIVPGELSPGKLSLALTGRRTWRSSLRIGKSQAEALAALVTVGEPGSHEELRELLDRSVQAGKLSELHRELVLRNGVDPFDARLVGGTAPYCYDSAGVFTVTGGSSENHRDGREQARSHLREVLSVAPSGESARLFSTQADFESARARGQGNDGWTTGPSLLQSGPGLSAAGSNPEDFADLLGQQALSSAPVSRAETLIAGRPGASLDEELSSFRPQTVRSALPGVVHFDEGAWGLTGTSPGGWYTGSGPLRLDPHALVVPVVAQLSERVQPFTIEFWFELEDVTAETVLFDGGADALEDRIVMMIKDSQLILRVSDHSFADVDARVPEGSLPPAGEIRYSFDDGLSLEAGVPYHVAAWIGGAKDTRLALFVDGFARGQRRFTTRLIADLPGAGGPFMGSNAGQGKKRVEVDNAVGFPERGVLRVGNEIMEYTSHDESSFLVAASGSEDPFGGRGKRNTSALPHESTEIVELLGYSIPLASRVASRGNGNLVGELSAFSMAELDPDALVQSIMVNPTVNGDPTDFPFEIGTGLSSDATTIPVRGLNGEALPAGIFQSGGGYALLFGDLGFDAVAGQRIVSETIPGLFWRLPAETIDGFPLGGAEIISYDRYADGVLNNVLRGGDPQAVPDSLDPGHVSELDGAADPWVLLTTPQLANRVYTENHAFITKLSNHAFSELSVNSNAPEYPRTLVIPLSVAVDDGLGVYEGYHPQRPADSYLTQIGLDFPEGGEGTEWFRWNTATSRDMLVRDDLNAVEGMLSLLSADGGLGAWNPDVSIDDEVLDQLNEQLRFRGQDGTQNTAHGAGEQVLPVLWFGEWGMSSGGAVNGLPGRHDFVTLVDGEGAREWNTINHGAVGDIDYPNGALVAFRQGIVEDFINSDESEASSYQALELLDIERSLEEGESGARLMDELELSDRGALEQVVERFTVESRRITRLLKAPSGELPSLAPGELHFGETFDRQPSQGQAIIDELRFSVAEAPGPLVLSTARYVLDQELEFEEDGVLLLDLDELHFVHGRRRSGLFGPERLETMGELPPSGGLLLVGEEIVAYAGYDHLDSGALFLAARGLYGTERAVHSPGSPVVPLAFWPSAPLSQAMSDSDFLIPLADSAVFPSAGGLLRIDDELLAYDRVEPDGLSMPTTPGRRPAGLARGRFGTVPAEHPAGSLVRWQPTRYVDGSFLADASVPEAQFGRLTVDAPGAFFTDVTMRVEPLDPAVELIGFTVLDRESAPLDAVESSGRRALVSPGERLPNQYFAMPMHHGDRLELLLGVRWNPGAFDPFNGASHGWKLAPVVNDVVVRHVQPTLVLEHEEWR
ncbi:MAG: hypothetical protein ACI9EF_001584, partial [Pseudohongiellaceae bacterium]